MALPRFSCLTLALAAAVSLVSTASVNASPLDQVRGSGSLAKRLSAADLVFVGRVADVRYAMSAPSPDGVDGPQPFTFVTFDVERLLHGSSVGPRVTLRFAGGLHDDGLFTTSSAGTLFDVGERSVLFVHGNGSASVPLVGGRAGRLRLVDGHVFDDAGRRLSIDDGDRLIAGAAEPLPEIRSHYVKELKRDLFASMAVPRAGILDVDAPDAPGYIAADLASTPPTIESPQTRADVTEKQLIAVLGSIATRLPPATRKVTSADSTKSFWVPSTVAVPAERRTASSR